MAKKLDGEVLLRWHKAAEAMQIPREFYKDIQVRVIEDPSGRCKYTFGVVYNPGRYKRPGDSSGDVRCHMCRMVEEAQKEPAKNIFPDWDLEDFIATPNGFPPTEGAILIITTKEIPMYDTNHLKTLGEGERFLNNYLNLEINLVLVYITKLSARALQ